MTTPAQQQMAAGSDPWWYSAPDVWDTVVIGGKTMPGIAKIKGKLGRKLQVNSPPGSDGATLRDRGYNPAKFTISLKFWSPDQWTAYQALSVSLLALSGPRAALQVSHPVLKLAGITAAYLEDMTLLEDGPERGTKQVEITMTQFKAPTARPAAPVQASNLIRPDAETQQQNPTSAQNTPSTSGAAAPPAALNATQ